MHYKNNFTYKILKINIILSYIHIFILSIIDISKNACKRFIKNSSNEQNYNYKLNQDDRFQKNKILQKILIKQMILQAVMKSILYIS